MVVYFINANLHRKSDHHDLSAVFDLSNLIGTPFVSSFFVSSSALQICLLYDDFYRFCDSNYLVYFDGYLVIMGRRR